MSKGIGATKRKKALKAREKQTLRKAAKKLAQFVEALPKISEDDLLSFQFAHFGDGSKPERWFVKPEEAIDYQPEWDDGLGWYEDGVKRTLTDEAIAVFRRTEEWQLERAEERRRRDLEEERDEREGVGAEDFDPLQEPAVQVVDDHRAKSPVSDVSSLEEELMDYAGITKPDHDQRIESRPAKSSYPRPLSRASPGSRSATPTSASGSNQSISERKKKKKSRGQHEVPYDQRHKRKWENFIQDQDPVEGSLTHRRLARELDDQKERRVEMDY